MNLHHLLFSTIISISLISSAFGAEYADAIIRYDGVYEGAPEIPKIEEESEIEEGSEVEEESKDVYSLTPSCTYLRFYPDGTVITVGTECNAKPLNARELKKFKKWFSKGHENIGRGKFTIHEKTISFSSVYSMGTVDYSGEVSNNTMRLTYFSNINQNQNTNSYVFIKW